jgi:hypothetical protein
LLGADILLVKLKDVLIFFKDHALPEGALLFERLIIFKDVVAVLLHEADVGLIEVLAVVFEQDEEDAIVIDSPIF